MTPSAASASMAGAALVRAPYAARALPDNPSMASSTTGPWRGGDSRAYHQPTAAAPTAAVQTSVMMRVACQRWFRTRGWLGIRCNGSKGLCGALLVTARGRAHLGALGPRAVVGRVALEHLVVAVERLAEQR